MSPESPGRARNQITIPELVTQPTSEDLQNLGERGKDPKLAQTWNAANAARTCLPASNGDLEPQAGSDGVQIATLKQAPAANDPTQTALQILGNTGDVQTTPSGLEVVTRPQEIAIAEEPLETSNTPLGELTPDASSQLLLDNIPQAVIAQLKAEEFSGNTKVSGLFAASYSYIQEIRTKILPWAIAQKAQAVAEHPPETPALQAETLADTSVDILQGLPKITEIPESLEPTHEKATHQIQSASMETIEQLSIILAKMLASSREFNQRRTEEILDTWLLIINTKGHTRRELILRNSTGIGRLLVTALAEQPLLLTPSNWKRIIAIADWLEFNAQDAEKLLLLYQKSGLSMRDPVITRLALQVETKRPNGEFAKNQEELRQQFRERWETHKKDGTLPEFIKPGGEADKIINQIVFAVPPAKLRGAVGFEIEGFLHYPYKRNGTLQTQNFIAFKLPEQFYFNFPGNPINEHFIPIEIKPGLEFCKGQNALQSALLFTLWAKRNSHVFTPASLHIHLNQTDFPPLSELYKHGIAIFARKNSLGTLELREWTPPYTASSTLLNRMLFGILPAEEWQTYMFSIMAQQPSFLELYLANKDGQPQKTFKEYTNRSRFTESWGTIVQVRDIMRSGLHSPNMSVATGAWQLLIAHTARLPTDWIDLVPLAMASPHENIAYAALNLTIPDIIDAPKQWTTVLKEGLNSQHREVALKTLEIIKEIASKLPEHDLTSLTESISLPNYPYPDIALAIIEIIKPRIIQAPYLWYTHIKAAVMSPEYRMASAILDLIQENLSKLKDEEDFFQTVLTGALSSPYPDIAEKALKLAQNHILKSPNRWGTIIATGLRGDKLQNAQLLMNFIIKHKANLCESHSLCIAIASAAIQSPFEEIALKGLELLQEPISQTPRLARYFIEEALKSTHERVAHQALKIIKQYPDSFTAPPTFWSTLIIASIQSRHPSITTELITMSTEQIVEDVGKWRIIITRALLSPYQEIAITMANILVPLLRGPIQPSVLREIVAAGLLSPHPEVANILFNTILPHLSEDPFPWAQIIAPGLRSHHKDIASAISQNLLENVDQHALTKHKHTYWLLVKEGLRSPHPSIRGKSKQIAIQLISSEAPSADDVSKDIVQVIEPLINSDYPEAEEVINYLLQQSHLINNMEILATVLPAVITLPNIRLAQLGLKILYEHLDDIVTQPIEWGEKLKHAIEHSRFPQIRRAVFDIYRLTSSVHTFQYITKLTDSSLEGPALRESFGDHMVKLVAPKNRKLFLATIGVTPWFAPMPTPKRANYNSRIQRVCI